MYRTFLSALIAAAACAPLAAAPSPAFDELSGNELSMPVDTLSHGSRLARSFVPAQSGDVAAVEVRLMFDGPAAQLVATLLAADDNFLPGAGIAKADIEIVAGQQDVRLEFAPGAAVVAGQQYFMMLTADADFAWLGDFDADGRLLCGSDDGTWAEISGFRAALAVTTAQPVEVDPAQPQPPVMPSVSMGAVSIARTAATTAVIGTVDFPATVAGLEVIDAPAGMRITNLRLQGHDILADIFVHAVVAEGMYQPALALALADGVQVMFNVMVQVQPNTAPVLAMPGEAMVAMSEQARVALAAQDAEQDFGALTFSFEVDNTALVDAAGIELSPGRQELVINPRAGHVGMARITVRVIDAGGLDTSAEFTLTVGDAQKLWIEQFAGEVVLVDGEVLTIALSVHNAVEIDGELPMAYALDEAVLPQESFTVGGSDGAYTLAMSAPAGSTGATMVIVTFTRGDITATMAFRVTLAHSMILSAQAPAAAAQDADFEGGCSAGAGSGVAALALAGLPVVFRRRK